MGSLLLEGTSIRLSGQDSRRGTFSHRHSTLVDFDTTAEYVPLSTLCSDDTNLWIYDSLLSEYAALGFEYGYSVANPDALVIWEAQFRRLRQRRADHHRPVPGCREGQVEPGLGTGCCCSPTVSRVRVRNTRRPGSSASSCWPPRTTCSCATRPPPPSSSICCAARCCTTSGLPLVVFTPKSLLRAKQSRSPVAHLLSGTFEELLTDQGVADPQAVRRVVFCSGKIAYDAMAERDRLGAPVAIVRVEQLYPWPFDMVAAELAKYPNTREDVVWLQEEPENMGSWNSIKGRLYERHGDTHDIRRVSRFESGSPACGSAKVHAQEHAELLDKALTV